MAQVSFEGSFCATQLYVFYIQLINRASGTHNMYKKASGRQGTRIPLSTLEMHYLSVTVPVTIFITVPVTMPITISVTMLVTMPVTVAMPVTISVTMLVTV